MNTLYANASECPPFRSIAAPPSASRDALGELLDADIEYDAARDALVALNCRIAEYGWIDLEFDALREASQRFHRVQMRRRDVIGRLRGFLMPTPPSAEKTPA